MVTSVDNTDSVSEVKPVADIKLTCDMCDYSSTSQKSLNVRRIAKHKEKKDQKSREALKLKENEQNSDTANLEEFKIIESKLEAYCHKYDTIFRCKELLLYRNHCKVAHSWLCCDREKTVKDVIIQH